MIARIEKAMPIPPRPRGLSSGVLDAFVAAVALTLATESVRPWYRPDSQKLGFAANFNRQCNHRAVSFGSTSCRTCTRLFCR
jgi:hypothetical protein